jgi:hypothetical protein
MRHADIACACKAEVLPTLKVLGFLHDHGLLASDQDGRRRTIPRPLAELRYRLHHAGRSTAWFDWRIKRPGRGAGLAI